MKKDSLSLIAILLYLISLLLTGNPSFANDKNYTLSVSCIIPAIPGVNAPLIEEETVKTQTETTIRENTKSKEKSDVIMQSDTEKETTLPSGKTAIITVKTIYSR